MEATASHRNPQERYVNAGERRRNVPNRPNLDERGCPLLDAEFNCGGRQENTPRFGSMLRREHFVDLFRRRFYHLTFIVLHL
jgi:hypothetical protein